MPNHILLDPESKNSLRLWLGGRARLLTIEAIDWQAYSTGETSSILLRHVVQLADVFGNTIYEVVGLHKFGKRKSS